MYKLILTALLLTVDLDAHAENTVPNELNSIDRSSDLISVSGKLSTLGLGVEAGFPITPSLSGRFGLNTFSYNFNKVTALNGQSTTYNGNLNLQTLQALADWHPFESNFRFTSGLVYNNSRFTGKAEPTGGIIVLGGTQYTVGSASVNATVDFNKLAPYIGFGWAKSAKRSKFSFTSDFGILFAGTPKTNVSAVDFNASAADIANANASLKDSLGNLKYYPVVSLGFGYSF
jgi:hypothetical protein